MLDEQGDYRLAGRDLGPTHGSSTAGPVLEIGAEHLGEQLGAPLPDRRSAPARLGSATRQQDALAPKRKSHHQPGSVAPRGGSTQALDDRAPAETSRRSCTYVQLYSSK
jgi:hypothetical protein